MAQSVSLREKVAWGPGLAALHWEDPFMGNVFTASGNWLTWEGCPCRVCQGPDAGASGDRT